MYGFEGWLLKVNGVIFPTSLIRAETYMITPDQETDIDDYTDGDGEFRRNILPKKASKIEFETPPVHLDQAREVFRIIPEEDNALTIEYWNPRKFIYQSGDAYVPDIQYTLKQVYPKEKDIMYDQIRIAFIEYGEMR